MLKGEAFVFNCIEKVLGSLGMSSNLTLNLLIGIRELRVVFFDGLFEF
jgi:hypothetical protein